MTRTEAKKLEAARSAVRAAKFGTPEFDAAFEAMRKITQAMVDAAPREEFCSVDSGVHRTRLASGKII